MDKTVTVYKDHTNDEVLAVWTGSEDLIPSFKAACEVRFKDYPKLRFEIT